VLVIVATVIAVGAFLVLRPEDEDESEPAPATSPQAPAPETTPEPRPREPEIQTVRVRGGRPVGGVQTIEVERGETARFRVRTEMPQEVHLHGYDITENSTATKPAEFRFEAGESGVFEIELERTHTQIAELKVE
jgi:hypothetical protein